MNEHQKAEMEDTKAHAEDTKEQLEDAKAQVEDAQAEMEEAKPEMEDTQAEAEGSKARSRKKPPKESPQIMGPITDQSGQRKTKYAGKGRLTKFDALPIGMKSEAERLLADGFTFEETTEWINQRHVPEKKRDPQGITLSAVADYFRSNLDMQARRVHRLQEVAQELKRHLTGDPNSALGEAAYAILVTGLMGLTNASANFTVRDAQRHYLAQERLHQQGQVSAVRIVTETLKQEEARAKISALKRAIQKESGRRRLGAETLKSIQEIYGLIDFAPEAQPLDAKVEALAPATSAGNEEPA